MSEKPIGAGKSSFSLIEEDKLFAALPLSGKTAFLDLACGNGSYALALSQRVDDEAVIYAVDLWDDGINQLKAAILERNILNVRALLSDVERTLLPDESVDFCLLASVLHDLMEVDKAESTFKEIVRVMKPGGDLVVIEFKKIPPPPGPPAAIRLTPEQVIRAVSPFGFDMAGTIEIGPYHYLCRFRFNP